MYALPLSLQDLERDVGEFGARDRNDFISVYLKDANLAVSANLKSSIGPVGPTSILPLASRLINHAHQFVESARLHRVKVSFCRVCIESVVMLCRLCVKMSVQTVYRDPEWNPMFAQVSIRDIVRCFKLFDVFLTGPIRSDLVLATSLFPWRSS